MYERNNVDKTRAVLVSFTVCFVSVVLLLWLEVDAYFPVVNGVFEIDFLSLFLLRCFLLIINGILFFIWFQSIHSNYNRITRRNELWDWMKLFIPFVNIVFISSFIFSLKIEYSKKITGSNISTDKRVLKIWSLSFAFFHLMIAVVAFCFFYFKDNYSNYESIAVFIFVPLFITELISLASMMKIIKDVNQLEADFFKKSNELDIADHFVGED